MVLSGQLINGYCELWVVYFVVYMLKMFFLMYYKELFIVKIQAFNLNKDLKTMLKVIVWIICILGIFSFEWLINFGFEELQI